MITKKRGVPITAGRTEYSKKKPLVPNAADTSADAQTMIDESPMPFKNRNSVPQIPAGTHSYSRANSQFQKDALRYGATGRANSVRGMEDPSFPAVGYESGSTKPKFSRGKGIISGTPTQSRAQSGTISTNLGPDATEAQVKGMRSVSKLGKGWGAAYADFKRFGG